jgi:NTP pyrophosphatase (non-canonical NTP hydrolase)
MSASDDDTTVAELRSLMQAFNEARDWGQFHTLKDLAMAVSVEANELLELFLWKSGDAEIDMQRLREELADVFITALNVANTAGIDIAQAVRDKVALNGARYPVSLSKGKALKYTELK